MMKRLNIFLILLSFTTGIAKAQFIKAELQVSGLSCALCARATEKSLKKLPFISEVKPDLMRNIFVITFKDGITVNFDEIGKSVKEAGFFVNNLKATFNFNNVKVAGNHFNYGGDTYELMNATDQSLSGPVAITLVDKGFAPRSVSKKYLNLAPSATAENPGKVYHVAII